MEREVGGSGGEEWRRGSGEEGVVEWRGGGEVVESDARGK